MDIRRDLILHANTLTVITTVCNTGTRSADILEYQHNFVSIDGKPAGPGHRLEIPWDTQLKDLERSFHSRTEPDRSKIAEPAARVENGTAHWIEDMEMKTFMKTTPGEALEINAPFTWRLSHNDSDASITEICHFAPEKLVLWGNEHCICPEIFVRICLEPGHKQIFSRTWLFEDDSTRNEKSI